MSYSNYRDQPSRYSNRGPQDHAPASSRHASKKRQLKNRLQEIVELCRDQNHAATRDIAGVIQAEKGIQDLLLTHQDSAAPQGQHTPLPANLTPIRTVHNEESLHQDIGSIIGKNSHVTLNDEALRVIEEIQRRAQAEIAKVKEEKNALIRRVQDLQKALDGYRRGVAANQPPADVEALYRKIAYLQGVLAQQGQGVLPDFNVLYEQGQAIRRDTIRLLKIKEGKSDDEEKRRLRQQVTFLQRKVESLQGGRAGKASYDVIQEEYSPIVQTHKRVGSYRNSANEYQSMLMEMRKISGS